MVLRQFSTYYGYIFFLTRLKIFTLILHFQMSFITILGRYVKLYGYLQLQLITYILYLILHIKFIFQVKIYTYEGISRWCFRIEI